MKNKNHYVAIMAGGVGSRFWPMSKSSFPKQFLDILNTGSTLIQATFERFVSFIPEENIFVVTSQEYVSIVQDQLPLLPAQNIIAEPERKNTAACIAYISFKLNKINPDANLIVAPSDHLIGDLDLFTESCLKALEFTSQHQALVTLGIKPTHANTGYGYIQYENSQGEVHPVIRFTEKPHRELASKFLSEGNYLWNSGIFIWKVSDILDSFETYASQIFQIFLDIISFLNTPHESQAIAYAYENISPISIDYAVMEKAKNVFIIPVDFSWNDLGTWNSAWENFQKDGAQNASNNQNTILVDSKGCMVHSNEKKVVVIGGLEDMIVVNTPEALLICKKENEQQIKEYVARVKEITGELYI